MPREPWREVVFAAMHRFLQAGFPEMVGPNRAIDRNPVDELPQEAELPLLRCYDGPHSSSQARGAVGELEYALQWIVSGHLEARSAPELPDLDAQMNLLQARLIETIIPAEAALAIPLADGVLEIWPEDGMFEPDRFGAEVSERGEVRFVQEFTLRVRLNRGTAFLETP